MTWEVIEQAKRRGKGATLCISFKVRDLEERARANGLEVARRILSHLRPIGHESRGEEKQPLLRRVA